MDRRERFNNISVALQAALEGFQAGLWTALPAIIQSFDPVKMTCVAQPAVKARVLTKEGNYEWVTMPQMLDCPVMFPGGGGFTLTFPVAAGDEALMVCASRCIDTWWQSGGINNVQAELRMHDLSDGFALVGVRSQPRVLDPAVLTTGAQLRSDDGKTYVYIQDEAVRIQAQFIKVHASTEDGPAVYGLDVGGYGETVINDGAGNITINKYEVGAIGHDEQPALLTAGNAVSKHIHVHLHDAVSNQVIGLLMRKAKEWGRDGRLEAAFLREVLDKKEGLSVDQRVEIIKSFRYWFSVYEESLKGHARLQKDSDTEWRGVSLVPWSKRVSEKNTRHGVIRKIEVYSYGRSGKTMLGSAANGHWVVRGYRFDGKFYSSMADLKAALQ